MSDRVEDGAEDSEEDFVSDNLGGRSGEHAVTAMSAGAEGSVGAEDETFAIMEDLAQFITP